jgi:hypothetical protein
VVHRKRAGEDVMHSEDFLEELLLKYDLDELLDIFISNYNLTPNEFCNRMSDYIDQLQEDEIDR